MAFGKVLQSIAYIAVGGGVGYALMKLAPTDDQIKDKMKEKEVYNMYAAPEHKKMSRDFTNVLIASATSGKTIYGAKQAKEQRLHERVKELEETTQITKPNK